MANKLRIMILDTYYPEFLDRLPAPSGDYDEALREVLDASFGTSDFYSRNLSAMGFDAFDVIANHYSLQELWHQEFGDALSAGSLDIVKEQLAFYKPNVLFCQDLSYIPAEMLRSIKEKGIKLMAQCSCPMPPVENIKQFDVIFTSFPHYVDEFRKLGVRAVYNPLAFESTLLDRLPRDNERVFDVSFIGGVGTPSHWSYGMEVLETIAREIETSMFWGYGYERLPVTSAIRPKYVGPAWGRSMYSILLRSKIVINRHGEVARNYANNMKLYETTGCGALLMTDLKSNLHDFFRIDTECVAYSTPQDCVDKIKDLLADNEKRDRIARAGQQRTLADHTYKTRMGTIAKVIEESFA